MVFCKGSRRPGSKFGHLRKTISTDPHRLTTHQVEISVTNDGVSIINPLNKGFGYSNFIIPFGKVARRSNSLFWFDEWGRWRQLRFDKSEGWALVLSGGRAIPYNRPNPSLEPQETGPRFDWMLVQLG